MYISFPLKNIAYIGLRSVDPGEAKFLSEANVAVFSMKEVENLGIQNVLCKALDTIDPTGCKSIHLSFDIDALDCLEAPCTTVPGNFFSFVTVSLSNISRFTENVS